MHGYAPPPVESTLDDLHRLLATPDEELHPEVEPAELSWGPARARRSVVEDHFTFPSPLPSGDENVDTVHCVRWRATKRTGSISRRQKIEPAPFSRTALVCVHGAFAPTHRRVTMFLPPWSRATEWDTISMELPHHMRRERPSSEHSGQYLVSADVVRLVRGMHQSETDIRALVGGLRRTGYSTIVLFGMSLGGNAVLESLIYMRDAASAADAAVVLAPAVDAYVSLWLSILGETIRSRGNAHGITDELAERACRLITPLHMGAPAIPGERILVVYGRNDLLCPAGPTEALIRAWRARYRALETGHATCSLRFWTIRRLIASWIKATAAAGAGPGRAVSAR